MAKRKSLKEAKRLSKLALMDPALMDSALKDSKKGDDDAVTVSTDVTSMMGDDGVESLADMERPAWWVGEWPPKDMDTAAACCGECEHCRAAKAAAEGGLAACQEEEEEPEEGYQDAREFLPEDPRGARSIRL